MSGHARKATVREERIGHIRNLRCEIIAEFVAQLVRSYAAGDANDMGTLFDEGGHDRPSLKPRLAPVTIALAPRGRRKVIVLTYLQ